LAPVGGTMWEASPAKNIRPKRIGSATKLRKGAMLFSIERPVTSSSAAFWSIRRFNSSQKRSSGHCVISSSSGHCT
jgi:hypothetical protein